VGVSRNLREVKKRGGEGLLVKVLQDP